jgi:hypothetical protein
MNKPHPKLPLRIEMAIEAIGKKNGPWYVTSYRICNTSGEIIFNLGLSDWADWDKTGDLLFARNGCVYRQSIGKSGPSSELLLADFNQNKFKAIEPTDWAEKL